MTSARSLLSTWFGCGRSHRSRNRGFGRGDRHRARAQLYAGLPRWHFLALAAALGLPGGLVRRRDGAISGVKDPGFVVVDEVLGQWIALAGPRPLIG